MPMTAVAAWGVRFADRSFNTQRYTDWFSSEQIEQALQHLTLAAAPLNDNQSDPTRLCWVFEHARIFLALRPDNACLGIFAENRPDFSFDAIERVLDEFLALREE
jgi:hypothetical protein